MTIKSITTLKQGVWSSKSNILGNIIKAIDSIYDSGNKIDVDKQITITIIGVLSSLALDEAAAFKSRKR